MFKRLAIFSAFALCVKFTVTGQGLPAIGKWREHLPYGSATHVATTPGGIFTATRYSAFFYEYATGDIHKFSKVSGLAETGISCIGFHAATGRLIIAYNNSNIDLLSPGNVFNINDIKRKNITGDKSIYKIYFNNNTAYLSTGFGVVLVDLSRNEIQDTWLIGNGGQQVKVTGITSDSNFFYAATTEGLKRAPKNADLRNFGNWQSISGINGLQQFPAADVQLFNNKIIALVGDTVMIFNGNSWAKFFISLAKINSITVSETRLLVAQQTSSTAGRLTVLRADGSTESSIQQPAMQSPQQAVSALGNYWIADRFTGLLKAQGSSIQIIIPNSPFERSSGEMIFHKGKLFVAAGEVNNAWNYTYNRFGLFKFENNSWSYFNQYNNPKLDSVMDVITVAGNPRNEEVYYGSFGGGLVKLSSAGEITIYKQNSPVSAAIGDPSSYRVSGLAFDKENNLWISNYGALNNVLVKKPDNTWVTFNTPFALGENAVSQVSIDENNRKWIVSPKGNGLVCFDHGSAVENKNDDRWRLFKTGASNGNLPDNEVFCTAVDKNGLVWVGTAKGICIITCDDPFSNSCQAYQPIVAQGNFAGPLFASEEVKSIAVDGANRKWVGTKNGLWLISEDGEKVISHFTEENSPLLSNNVLRIAIDPASGEVFAATFNGICSFRGTATESPTGNEEVVVFPNPVPPGYSGTIGIKNLPANSVVKITELDGRLVFQTRSYGGQAVWNGKDYRGRQVSSGAYLVLVTGNDGKEKLTTKIFIVK